MGLSIGDFDRAVVYGLTDITNPATRKPLLVDSQGRVILVGGGTAGATTVEGVDNGKPVAVGSVAKGSTAAAGLTSTASGANHQPLDVLIYDASGNPIVSFGGGTQYADGAAAATPTGTAVNWNDAGTQRVVSAAKPLPVVQTGTPGLPTGAATETTLAAQSAKLPAALGQATKVASLAVVPASDWTVPAAEVRPVTLQAAAAVIGNGTPIDVSGMSTLLLQVSGTFSGTVVYEFSLDSTNGTDGTWTTLTGESQTSGAIVTSATSSATARFVVVGMKMVRARVSTYGSGSITVIGRAQANEGPLPQTNVALYGPGTTSAAAVSTYGSQDVNTAGTVGVVAHAFQQAFNGATFDRIRNNASATLLASSARTTAQNAAFTNFNGKGCRCSIDVTAGSGFSITPKVQCQDSASGVWEDVLVGAAIVATGHVSLVVYPSIADVTNLAKNMVLGRACRVSIAVVDSTSATYSVAVDNLL